jgi:hypothetical protein
MVSLLNIDCNVIDLGLLLYACSYDYLLITASSELRQVLCLRLWHCMDVLEHVINKIQIRNFICW